MEMGEPGSNSSCVHSIRLLTNTLGMVWIHPISRSSGLIRRTLISKSLLSLKESYNLKLSDFK